MLTGLLLTIIAVLRWFPETATARWIERQVAEVRRRIGTIERRHIVFAVLLAVILVFAGEALAMLGPLDMGLVVLFDVSTYLDIVLATGTIAAVARGRGAVQFVVARLPRPRARARRKRPVVGSDRAPANDDEDRRPLAA